MYLSHKYKFLFLRTPKTASSSLSDFFIRNVDDPNAIYTEVEDSKLPGTLNEAIVGKYRPYAFYHFTLNQLIDENIITEQQAREYDVFALLRNPVDRQKSMYYFFKKFKSPLTSASLDEYKSWTRNGVFKNEANSTIRQTSLCKIGDQPVGRYWLYENLEEELFQFLYDRKIEVTYPLPQHKSGIRKSRKNEIGFDDVAMADLRRHFKEDFEMYERLTNGPIS